MHNQTNQPTQKTPTNHQRRVIYQARRGLKELDFYIDHYVKHCYLNADNDEQHTFETLLSYEDPDLLAYFLEQDSPNDKKVMDLIVKIKTYKHQHDKI